MRLKAKTDNCTDPYRSKAWVWLIFSIYYFIPLYYIHFTISEIALQLTAYFLFVGLYLWTFNLPREKAWIPIGLITLIAIGTTTMTVGSSTFFSYLGVLVGFSYATKIALRLIIGFAITVLALQFYLYDNYPFQYFGLPALMGLITTGIVGYMEKLRAETRAQTLKSNQEIQQLAIIAERERIARDLHDILGHTLSSIALKAELSEKLLTHEKIGEAKEHIRDLHQIARNSLSLVRQTVSGYKHRGLTGEVIDLCEKIRQQGFIVNLRGQIPTLSPRAETAVILALTELTTNLLRHSKATHCDINFVDEDQNLRICVRDNGKVKEIEQGNGLQGIQERLAAIAGDLLIDITDGCRFDIRLPKTELIQAQS